MSVDIQPVLVATRDDQILAAASLHEKPDFRLGWNQAETIAQGGILDKPTDEIFRAIGEWSVIFGVSGFGDPLAANAGMVACFAALRELSKAEGGEDV